MTKPRKHIKRTSLRVQIHSDANELVPNMNYFGKLKFNYVHDIRKLISTYRNRTVKCLSGEISFSFVKLISNTDIISNPKEEMLFVQYPINRELRDSRAAMIRVFNDALNGNLYQNGKRVTLK